ncbi:MAG: prepilin-type N-terminal cleavage/methylation domain-containing protein [Candidatus Omnitrophica bacterium]|jgi:prepilin-type N-terminal cleavage/methylation domain-containing protein|nr:prepilin-type N-terminal cleavage/methylation domain-containing protein [Candidatus Omnitrophota bacterium]
MTSIVKPYKYITCLCRQVNPITNSRKRAFTLLELIIVIIVVGILAAVGLNQYTDVTEKMRGAEARAVLGSCIKSVSEYYLKNSTVSTITDADLNIGSSSNQLPSGCVSANYFYYYQQLNGSKVGIRARRCTTGGKSPQSDRSYIYRIDTNPATGSLEYYCYQDSVWYGPYNNWPKCPF